MKKDTLVMWWCFDCEDKFYIAKVKSDRAFREGKKFYCVHCGSDEFTCISDGEHY